MNTLTARAYQLRHLSDDGLRDVQEIENQNNRYFTPYEINLKFNLPENGKIPESTWTRIENRVLSIYNIETVKVKNKIDHDNLELVHNVDLLIRRENLDFEHDNNNQNIKIHDYTKERNITESSYHG